MSRNPFIPCGIVAVWLAHAGSGMGAIVEFVQNSSPPGIVVGATACESATVVTTAVAAASSSGFCFTHWEIDEGSGAVRADDPYGRAKNPVSFTIYNPSVATAYYLPATNDADADAVPDWYEIHYFGTTTNEATFDGDGDGYGLLAEYQRNYNPLFAEAGVDGGISRSRASSAWLILDTNYFLYWRTSAPFGIHNYSAVVTNGAVDLLPVLGDSGGYRFAYWSVNGNRVADFFGRSLSSGTLAVMDGMAVVAQYFSIAEDADSDGIPDWYEWHYCGTTTNDAASDTDADGYSLAVEYARGYLPHLHDDMRDGGLSRSRAVVCAYYGPSYCPYIVNSDPGGAVYQYGFVTSGAQVATSPAPAIYAGWRFTHWTVDGARQEDDFGVALDQVAAVVTGRCTITAHYMEKELDSDLDGIPDWYENYFFGELNESGTSDPDGDGYSLAVEYARGYRPTMADRMVDGGISRSRTVVNAVNLQPYERVEHALVDGVLTRFFTAWPTNAAVSGMDFGADTTPGAGDWDGDGDIDLFVGTSGGVVRVYANVGSPYTLNFSERTAAFAGLASAWSGISHPYPALGDWNGDGRDDLAVGGDAGRVRIVSSPGNFADPQSPATSYDLAMADSAVALPSFAEVTGDGNLDLLVLVDDGSVRVYANSGNPAAPFGGEPVESNRLGTTVTAGTGISMGDLDGDGARDALASDSDGRIWEFYRTASSTYVLQSKVWGGSGPGFAHGLTVGAADLDGDGDVDSFLGYDHGGLMFLRDPKIGPPAGLRAFGGPNSILLQWEPDRQTRVRGYYVYRGTSAAGPFVRLTEEPVALPEYRDETAPGGATSYYHVTAVSAAYLPGNTVPRMAESPPSDVVSAAPRSVVLWMPDYAGRRGDWAVLQVNVENADGLSGNGLDIRISYDPAVIRPAAQVDATNATVHQTPLSESFALSDNGASATGLLQITGNGGAAAAGEGRLLNVVFGVDTGAVLGVQTTNAIVLAVLRDSGGQALAVDFADLAVLTVATAYFLGDVNGDGLLSMDDHHRLMDLLKKNSPPPTPEELYAGDINGNGELDQGDIPLLNRLIHGLPIYPDN